MSDDGPGPEDPELFGPLERSGAVRGWALVVLVVILGALLMPSATRAALTQVVEPAATASSETGSSTTLVPTTTAPTSTTTVAADIPASSIRVLVANGTNTNGAASSVGAYLTGKGFVVMKAVNALTTVQATQVYPINNAVTAAGEVAAALGLSASSVEPNSTPVPVASSAGATVVVIVGPDILSRATSTSAGA